MRTLLSCLSGRKVFSLIQVRFGYRPSVLMKHRLVMSERAMPVRGVVRVMFLKSHRSMAVC